MEYGAGTNVCSENHRCSTEEEGDVHCHGIAWSNDPNEVSAVFKYNNFFYTFLYDHWYTRGYVENSLEGYPMCDCIDKMPLITRADCTEVASADIDFTIDWSEDQNLSVRAGPLTGLQLQACNGRVFGESKQNANNDLASHINKMVADEQMTVETQAANFNTFVGYGQPNNNENEQACALALARQQGDYAGLSESARLERIGQSGTSSGSGGPIELLASITLLVGVVTGVILSVKSERMRGLMTGKDLATNRAVERSYQAPGV